MSYKLEKPYTDIQRADFICEHQGLNYYEDNNCIIMYLDTEKIVDGEAVDRTQDADYIAEQKAKAKESQKAELQLQIDELDKKRIRAIAEPSNKTTEQTWLQFYTAQIQDLRSQIIEL